MQVGGAGFAAAPLVPVQIPLADFSRSPLIESNDNVSRLCFYHTVPSITADPANDDTELNVVLSNIIVIPGAGSPVSLAKSLSCASITSFASRPYETTGYFGVTINNSTFCTQVAGKPTVIIDNISLPGSEIVYTLVYINPRVKDPPSPAGLYLYVKPGASWVSPADNTWYRQISITGPLTLPSDNIVVRAAVNNNGPNIPVPPAATLDGLLALLKQPIEIINWSD